MLFLGLFNVAIITREEGWIMLWRRVSGQPTWDWTNPFEEVDRMRMEMDRLTDSLTRRFLGGPAAGVFPLMNLTEDKDNYYVRAELPGLKADEVDISVTGKTLSIAGERKFPAEDEKAQYHRREREAGRFSRIISLPAQVDPDKVDAQCAEGVLTVVLPKTETAKPKQIAVKTA
jgi:HSP20 family protein